MKAVIYNHEIINDIVNALDQIEVRGISQARLIVFISNSLESGEIKNVHKCPEMKEGERE